MYDLEQAINDRHSIRMFLPDKPVPREMVDQALELAIRAPSNSNVQPWHLRLVSGAARERLVAALLARGPQQAARVPELPELFAHLRRELGKQGLRLHGHHPRRRRGPPDRGATQLGVLPRTAGRHRLHAPRPALRRQPRRRHVPADLPARADRTRTRHLRASVDRRLPRDRPRTAQHLARVRHPVRAGDRLSRPDLSRQQPAHRPQSDRAERRFHDARTVSLLVAHWWTRAHSPRSMPTATERTPSGRRPRSETAPCPPPPAARRPPSDTTILLLALRITSSVSSNASSSVKCSRTPAATSGSICDGDQISASTYRSAALCRSDNRSDDSILLDLGVQRLRSRRRPAHCPRAATCTAGSCAAPPRAAAPPRSSPGPAARSRATAGTNR